MGKCVDQVYFMEKRSERHGLKIAISLLIFLCKFLHDNF